MVEKGGTRKGEPFDIEEAMNIPDKLAKVRLARAIFGDDWYKKEFGEDPSLVEAKLAEQMKTTRFMLRELMTKCACPYKRE